MREALPGPGGELEQIQFLLGPASAQTTERYLVPIQDMDGCPKNGATHIFGPLDPLTSRYS